MKKIIALLLALLLVFSLAACGGEKEEKEGGKLQIDIKKDETFNPEDYLSDYYFPETVLKDNNVATAKILSIDPKGDWGFTLELYLENKTDKTLMFSVEDAAINHVLVDPFFATELSAGQKVTEEVAFSNETIAEYGIENVAKITFTLSATDAEDFAADPYLDEPCTIYPYGQGAYEEVFQYTPGENELVVFDTEDCTMIITGIDPGNMWGYAAKVYIENKTDMTLMISADNAALNDFDMDPLWAVEVPAHRQGFSEITWFSEDLEDQGIETVEKIWLEISVSNWDDWMADDILNEEIEFAPF